MGRRAALFLLRMSTGSGDLESVYPSFTVGGRAVSAETTVRFPRRIHGPGQSETGWPGGPGMVIVACVTDPQCLDALPGEVLATFGVAGTSPVRLPGGQGTTWR